MQVRLQMAEDVQGFSQEFVAGRMPGLTDLQVSRPEFERAVAGEENKELHGAICRMLEQGQMLALQSLNVSGCSFGDGGASALLEIIRGGALPELSSLRAQNCDVGARGAEAFGSACRDGVLSGVRLLDVRKNDFGGELGRDEVGGSFLLGQMSGTLEAVVHPSNPQSAALKGRVVLVDGWGKNKRDELWELVGTAVEGLERPGGSGLSVFLGLCDRFRPWFAPTFLGSLPSKTKALFLRGAEVSGKGWEALAGRVGALLSLESVDISKANLFGDIDALKSLLASLPASCKKIEIEGLKSAAPLTFVKSLEVVNLKGAELPGESEWRVLSDKLSELSLLQSVDVSESSLLEDLPSLEKLLAVLPGSCEKVGLEGLKAIDLSKESGWTSDATLKALRNLPKSLETVNLKGAAVSAEGWDSLIKSFSELSLLQSVDVSESSLLSNDADDLRRFLTALPVSCKTVRLKGLRTADLSAGADLSAQGRTTAISNFPTSVNSLKLKGAQLTSEGWATLAEKLSSLNMPFSGLNFVDLSESNLLGDISALRKFLNALPNSCKTVGKHDQIVLSGITSLDLSGNTEWQANEKEVVITNLPSTLETFNFSQIHQDRLFQQKATSSFWKSLEKSLYRLEHLKEFDFSYCTAGESQITHAFMGLPRCLEKLNVQGTSIVLDPRKPNRPKAGSQHDETWGSFGSSVRGMKQLKELILSSCSLNDKKVERVFNKLPDSLEKLDLENNRDILPGGWSVLGNRMSELKVLKELNLRRCNLNMERLAPMIPTLPVGLETLILAGNSEIVPDGWKTLADRLPMFVGMKVLDLEGCGLDDVSAIRLFPSLPSTLETLGLSRNKAIEARGWAALGTRVKSLEQLKRLSLSSCELTDSRVKELFQFLPAGLEEINISANHNLSDGVKAELKEKPSLKVIEKG
uniref:Uncharacterized protein n=1 Tax=Chromera velia CCMP2878 TaxID=1169474 RepID=A0A0G4H286_9ALVE|eukprot:Cvel_24329.t1-p1 / transcript=Cvel_24329.t1 / gene=Cvel_24329 / organism=Chromera_velia_CCMP2878 / gene_product=Leucine-rich repeat-containing protein 31, putative / transcript_product=Leucine-rich repeat-containing protein 31, putative / location=Cvel_scaffold2616:365-10523(+) / protein_length=921 / sequence_SO=supercontig / SO=protein_coding / is_pseudo=false